MSISVDVWSAMRTSAEPAIIVPVAALRVVVVGLSEEEDGRSTKGRFLVRFLSVIVRVGRENTRVRRSGFKRECERDGRGGRGKREEMFTHCVEMCSICYNVMVCVCGEGD